MNKEKTITLQVPEGKRAEWVNGVLTLVDELPVDITERVKTLEDAVEILGHGNPLVAELNAIRGVFPTMLTGAVSGDLLAYLELRIITAALNEGWSPTFCEEEMRYYPFYVFYRKEEVEQMDENKKKELGLFFGDALSGLAVAFSVYAWSDSVSGLGPRLAYKSRDLTIYSVKQFPELWYQFLIGDNQK